MRIDCDNDDEDRGLADALRARGVGAEQGSAAEPLPIVDALRAAGIEPEALKAWLKSPRAEALERENAFMRGVLADISNSSGGISAVLSARSALDSLETGGGG